MTPTCITLTHMQAKEQAQLLLAGDGGINRVAGAFVHLILPKRAVKIMRFKDPL